MLIDFFADVTRFISFFCCLIDFSSPRFAEDFLLPLRLPLLMPFRFHAP